MKRYKTVDDFIDDQEQWKNALSRLRAIILKTDTKETVKWGFPVYTYDRKNIVGMGAFKSYVGLWFFQGALLEDPDNKLVNAQEGKTVAMRQMRFESPEDIDEKLISRYIGEAIMNQKKGREIKPARRKPLIIPGELENAFKVDKKVAVAFNKLSLTRKREYTDYISEAKRETTRMKRLEKILPMICKGIGLHDKYK